MTLNNLISEAQKSQENFEHSKALAYYQVAEEKFEEEKPELKLNIYSPWGIYIN